MIEMAERVKTSHKKIAVSFLQDVIAGNIRDAYVKHVSPAMRHHNPYYPGDASSLEKGMIENDRQYPNKTIEIKHVIEDGDYVAVHSHVRLNPAEPGFSAVHMFRFEGDKVAELWDIVQSIPADSPNSNGMA